MNATNKSGIFENGELICTCSNYGKAFIELCGLVVSGRCCGLYTIGNRRWKSTDGNSYEIRGVL